MSRLARWGALLLAAAGLVALSRGDDAAGPAPTRSVRVAPGDPPCSDFRGAGSCSATACHGSILPSAPEFSAVLRNEHTTWVSNDAHSRAYQVLFDKRSDRIVRNLSPDPSRGYEPAHEDRRCLACHTTPRPSKDLVATEWMNADAVGCESCHGASGRWLGPHTTGEEWRKRTWKDKESLGFQDTKDLVRRTRLCVGCHVGDAGAGGMPAREVDHDLIAAGHPRLYFELSAYLDNMPAHWIEKGINGGVPTPSDPRPAPAADFPARAWAVGRLVAMEASLRLLEARAARAGSADALAPIPAGTAPWPEFTEYGCFSCHHDLRDRAWRRADRPAGTLAGSPRWGSWSLPATGDLVEAIAGGPEAHTYAESLRRLASLMEQPVPDAAAVARESRAAAGSLTLCFREVAPRRFDGGAVERLIGRLDRPDAWDRIASWDEAAHLFLNLTPLCQSWVKLAPGRNDDQARLQAHLRALREQLAFPPRFDSPKEFDPAKISRPGR